MNEVRINQAPVFPESGSTSSKGSGLGKDSVAATGKVLPEDATGLSTEEVSEPVASLESLGQVVAQMNDYVQSEHRDLRFSIDDMSGETVVRVLDRDSGDLIRQIPNEIFLKMAASVEQREELRLISVQG